MSIITVDSEDSEFTKDRLIDGDYSNPFRFNSLLGGVIDVDFLTSISFDSVFIGNHNFDSSAGIVVKTGDVFPPTTVTDTPGYRVKNIISKFTGVTARYLRIEITDANATLTEIGELVVGVRTVLPRGIRFGHRPGILQEMILERTNRGKRYALELFELERREYTFRFPDSQRSSFRDFWEGVNGSLDPFVWIENDLEDDPAESLFVSIETPGFNLSELDEPAPDSVFDYSLTLIEEGLGGEIAL